MRYLLLSSPLKRKKWDVQKKDLEAIVKALLLHRDVRIDVGISDSTQKHTNLKIYFIESVMEQ